MDEIRPLCFDHEWHRSLNDPLHHFISNSSPIDMGKKCPKRNFKFYLSCAGNNRRRQGTKNQRRIYSSFFSLFHFFQWWVGKRTFVCVENSSRPPAPISRIGSFLSVGLFFFIHSLQTSISHFFHCNFPPFPTVFCKFSLPFWGKSPTACRHFLRLSFPLLRSETEGEADG